MTSREIFEQITDKILIASKELGGITEILTNEIPEIENKTSDEKIKKSAFQIMVDLQKEDILQQQMEHIYNNLKNNMELITDQPVEKEMECVTGFLILTTERQISRIGLTISKLIAKIEGNLLNIGSETSAELTNRISNYKTAQKELLEYNNILSKILDEEKYEIDLSNCSYKETTIKEIIENMTVNEERTTLLKEFPELDIEQSMEANITLF